MAYNLSSMHGQIAVVRLRAPASAITSAGDGNRIYFAQPQRVGKRAYADQGACRHPGEAERCVSDEGISWGCPQCAAAAAQQPRTRLLRPAAASES